MGQHESKPTLRRSSGSFSTHNDYTPPTIPRSNSLPNFKSSSPRKNMQHFTDMAKYLLARVQSFQGFRGDPAHKNLEQEIVSTSARLQEFRKGLKKDSDRLQVDDVQKLISSCLAVLISKVQENESVRESIQSAQTAVVGAPIEEVVVIRHPEKKVVKQQPKSVHRRSYNVYSKRNGRLRTLAQIEKAVYELKEDAVWAIRNDDEKVLDAQLEIIKKIGTDLEMIEAEKYTPLCETKDTLYKTLVKINANIKKTKRRLSRPHATDSSAPPVSKSRKELAQMERTIDRLESSVLKLTPEELASCEELKAQLQQILRRIPEIANDETAKLQTMYRVDKLLERIEEIELEGVQQQLVQLKQLVFEFSGVQGSAEYVSLDQKLRKLWANLGRLDGDVHGSKKFLINEIQGFLQTLMSRGRENEQAQKKKQELLAQEEEEEHGYLKDILENIVEQSLVSTDILKEETLNRKEMQRIKEKLHQLRKHVDSMFNEISEKEGRLERASKISIDASPEEAQMSSFEEELRRKQLEMVNRRDNTSLRPQKLENFPLMDEPRRFYNQTSTNQAPQPAPKPTETDSTPSKITETDFGTSVYNAGTNLETNLDDTNKDTRPSTLTTPDILDDKPEKDIPTPSQPKNFKDLGERIDGNTVCYNFTAKKPISYKLTPIDCTQIQYKLHEMRAAIANFKGTSKNDDYHKLENDCLQLLDKLAGNHASTAKDFVQQISKVLDDLDEKVVENQNVSKQGRADLKQVVERIQNLKKRVDNFNGSFMNILYIQIENALRQEFRAVCRIEVVDDAKLGQAVEQTKQKIQQYLKILEEKSQKSTAEILHKFAPNQEKRTPYVNAFEEDPELQLQEMEAVFDEISTEIDNFRGNASDKNYSELEGTLIRLIIDLDKIPITNPEVKQKRRNLMQNIRSYTKILDNKAKEQTSPDYLAYETVEGIWGEFQSLKQMCDNADDNTHNLIIGKLKELSKRVDVAVCEDEETRRRCKHSINGFIFALEENSRKGELSKVGEVIV